jgi:PAS domain S-box-containing protein
LVGPENDSVFETRARGMQGAPGNERKWRAVTTLLVGLADRVAAAVSRILPEAVEDVVAAADAEEALRLAGASSIALIVLGGRSIDAVVASCRTLRLASICHDAVLVAAVHGGEQDVQAVLDAGADDFFVESLADGLLGNRLLVARRLAAQRLLAQRRGDPTVSQPTSWADREQFFEICLDLLSIAGFDGYLKKVNQAWTRALGWSAAELLGRPSLDFVHPEDREKTLQSRNHLIDGRLLTDFTNRYRCKDGRYLWLDWQVVPHGDRGLIYAAARNVTEARAVKEAMRELSESLATTLDSIGDGVIATDVNGAITRINRVAQQLTGWTADEALQRPIAEVFAIIDEESRRTTESPVYRALQRGVITGLPKHTLLVRRDGSEIPVADSCAPITSSDDVVSGAVLVFRDLTTERKTATVQTQYQQQLILADRMASVGTLAAGVAHEINNPLTYVTANLDLAIEEIRELSGGSASGRLKDLEELLLEAREGNARVSKIVRGLKTFSRIEEERWAVLDLIPVLELSLNMAFNEIRHRARLVKTYGELPLVDGDDARLGQVFINLLVNAAQAMPEGDIDANQISIVTSTDELGRAVVEIRDTGPGIAPSILGRIFDPFFTTKAVGVGTGLGLAICHNIITSMHGEISVQSELGKGTTFRVALPASARPTTFAPPTLPGVQAAAPRHGRVLVVDDEPAVGLAVRRVLKDHDVTVVTTAQEALRHINEGTEFDVILSDLMMPGMSGMDFYAVLARENPQVAARVVFVTGGAFTPGANAFLDRVANERLEKPFHFQQLRELVRKFVRHSQPPTI